MFNRKKFNQKIQQEFEDFKEDLLDYDSEEIFELAFEIYFKTTLTEYLQNEDLLSDQTAEKLDSFDANFIEDLFNIYLNFGFDHSIFDLIEEIIDDYLDYDDNQLQD